MLNKMRPTWDEYFIAIAKQVATRSLDPNTQHGCVLVKEKRIIGTGYNSFPPDMKDDELPLRRPEKYAWINHSERAALDNRTIIEPGFTTYITGEPCFPCLLSLYQNGVSRIVYGCLPSKMVDDSHALLKQQLYAKTKRKVTFGLTKSGFSEIIFGKVD